MTAGWKPSLGAWPENDGFRFRVWAPEVRSLELLLGSAENSYKLRKQADGTWTVHVPGCKPRTHYRYLADGNGPFPDPASRFQPRGIHGPSETLDPHGFRWDDSSWDGPGNGGQVFYELHIGTFTPEGTFTALHDRGYDGGVHWLAELGVNAIELMPLADFPGQHNWGYDGVCPFAPARCYGPPDELRRLVNLSHQLGIAVYLDVVYNHLGPDGNYTGVYSPYYVSKQHRTPWGDALNYDGLHSEFVREFFIENALHWIHEYHIDGLRLDATHAIFDDGPKHFLAELAERVHAAAPGRRVQLIAEDHGNLAHMVKPGSKGGWGLDGIWADDFHHELRRLLTGDCESYYRDYSGTIEDLAATINQGWFFHGQHSDHLGRARGTDPLELPRRTFVVCLQNHDQIGNRAFGERLHHQIGLDAYRAASALLLCLPMTPLLFMGQEWACSAPFRFFSDHTPELGRQVTEGRRLEFKQFSAFSDPQTREKIPDPQALETFEACRLDWKESGRPPHRGVWQLYRRLLELRRSEPALGSGEIGTFEARPAGESSLILERRGPNGQRLTLVCQLRGGGQIELPSEEREAVLTTEEAKYSSDPVPPVLGERRVEFRRPGAVLLREVSRQS